MVSGVHWKKQLSKVSSASAELNQLSDIISNRWQGWSNGGCMKSCLRGKMPTETSHYTSEFADWLPSLPVSFEISRMDMMVIWFTHINI